MGLTGRIHKAITSVYDNVKCCARLNGLKTDYFEVSCGLIIIWKAQGVLLIDYCFTARQHTKAILRRNMQLVPI